MHRFSTLLLAALLLCGSAVTNGHRLRRRTQEVGTSGYYYGAHAPLREDTPIRVPYHGQFLGAHLASCIGLCAWQDQPGAGDKTAWAAVMNEPKRSKEVVRIHYLTPA
jgi:hypothetical protein